MWEEQVSSLLNETYAEKAAVWRVGHWCLGKECDELSAKELANVMRR